MTKTSVSRILIDIEKTTNRIKYINASYKFSTLPLLIHLSCMLLINGYVCSRKDRWSVYGVVIVVRVECF